MLRGPDGRYWIFWGRHAGSGKTPGAIHRLERINLPVPGRMQVRNVHVSLDDSGTFHMVFDDGGDVLMYSSSSDGRNWTAPVCLVDNEERNHIANGQMIIDGERIVLVYETNKLSWLRRGTLRGLPDLGEAAQIATHVIPLNGSRLCVTGDGKVVGLAGDNTICLMRARIEDVWRERDGD